MLKKDEVIFEKICIIKFSLSELIDKDNGINFSTIF